MTAIPCQAHPDARRQQSDGMCLPTPVVPATVANLLELYGDNHHATGLLVEHFPAAGASRLYGADMRLLEDGRLVTGLPLDVLTEYAGRTPGLGLLHRLNQLLTGKGFPMDRLIKLEPPQPGERIINAQSSRTDPAGLTHRLLAEFNPTTQLLIWSPVAGDYVPAFVREYQSPTWASGQSGYGAVLVHPEGLEEHLATAVVAALTQVKAEVRAMLEL